MNYHMKLRGLVYIKWDAVRKRYPNRFILLMSLNEHIENNTRYIDDVVVRRILNDEEAGNVLVRCKGKNFVFHTYKPKLEMDIVRI